MGTCRRKCVPFVSSRRSSRHNMTSAPVWLARSRRAVARRNLLIDTGVELKLHPTPSRISLRSMLADPPPPGEGEASKWPDLKIHLQAVQPPDVAIDAVHDLALVDEHVVDLGGAGRRAGHR